jgi:hypothetical protein
MSVAIVYVQCLHPRTFKNAASVENLHGFENGSYDYSPFYEAASFIEF